MAKTLLIVSGGIEAVPGIQRAKEMGLHVVVSDGNPNAPGFKFADEIIIASTYDVVGTSQKVKNYHKNIRNINGVLCIASDVPLTVASIAAELNLPGIPVETAQLAMDKLAMKNKFREDNIAVPDFTELNSIDDLEKVIIDWGYPLVLKPIDNRGARGVLRLTDSVDINWAWNHSLCNSSRGRVMVEKFVQGPQISTEALIIDGVGYPIGFSDRNYEFLNKFSPFIIENGGSFPSIIDNVNKKLISELAIKAGISLGVSTGVIKGDMVLSKNGPMVIEVATRLSGGWFSTDQIPLGLGIDLVGSAIKIALGEKIDTKSLTPKNTKGVAVRYFFPKLGKVVEIKNCKNIKKKVWVHRLGIFVNVGDKIKQLTNHTERAGIVITSGRTCGQAISRADKVIRTVEIVTTPT